MTVAKNVKKNKELTMQEQLMELRVKADKTPEDYEKLIELEKAVMVEKFQQERDDGIKEATAKFTSSVVRSTEQRDKIKIINY